jgi:hypothetical protein
MRLRTLFVFAPMTLTIEASPVVRPGGTGSLEKESQLIPRLILAHQIQRSEPAHRACIGVGRFGLSLG